MLIERKEQIKLLLKDGIKNITITFSDWREKQAFVLNIDGGTGYGFNEMSALLADLNKKHPNARFLGIKTNISEEFKTI